MKYWVKWFIILLSFNLAYGAAAQKAKQSTRWSITKTRILGADAIADLNNENPTIVSFFWQDQYRLDPYSSRDYGLELKYKLVLNPADNTTYTSIGQQNIKNVTATISRQWSHWGQSIFGLQEVSWGENLFMPILDLVNPRDVTNPRGYYDSGNKLSQLMLRQEYQKGDYSLQLIVIPLTRRTPFPEAIAGFGVKQPKELLPGQGSEYGAKLSQLINALEMQYYILSHLPRNPSYTFASYSGNNELEVNEERILTLGTSFAIASQEIVYRGDFALHNNYPASSVQYEIERTNLIQSIVGAEYVTQSAQTFGIEAHIDLWEDQPETYSNGPWASADSSQAQEYFWLGISSRMTFFNDILQPQFFYFRGVSNDDTLIRILTDYNIGDDIKVNFEVQSTSAATTSPKFLLGDVERSLMSVTYTF